MEVVLVVIRILCSKFDDVTKITSSITIYSGDVKVEYSNLTYYVNNNMLLEDIPEFKCYNRKQINILNHLAMFNVDEYVQI